MQTTEDRREVAKMMLAQLGGNRFLVMTGARNLLATSEPGLSFRIPNPAAGRPNYVKITLEPSDTYNVEFGRVRGTNYKQISQHDGIYCDMLQELFTQETGLDTHL